MILKLAFGLALVLCSLAPSAAEDVPYSQQRRDVLTLCARERGPCFFPRRHLAQSTDSAAKSATAGPTDNAAPAQHSTGRKDFAGAQRVNASAADAHDPRQGPSAALRVRNAFFLVVAIALGVAFGVAVVVGWNLAGQVIERLRRGWNEAELMPLGPFGRRAEQRADADSTQVALLRDFGGGEGEGEEPRPAGSAAAPVTAGTPALAAIA